MEKRPHDQALVELGGIRKPISIALVPEANVGDYVIVHVGHAIGVLDPDEAQKTLAMFAEMQAAEGGPGAGPLQSGPTLSGGSEPPAVGSVGVEVLP